MRLVRVLGLGAVLVLVSGAAAAGFDRSYLSMSEARHDIQRVDEESELRTDPNYERNAITSCQRLSKGAITA